MGIPYRVTLAAARRATRKYAPCHLYDHKTLPPRLLSHKDRSPRENAIWFLCRLPPASVSRVLCDKYRTMPGHGHDHGQKSHILQTILFVHKTQSLLLLDSHSLAQFLIAGMHPPYRYDIKYRKAFYRVTRVLSPAGLRARLLQP